MGFAATIALATSNWRVNKVSLLLAPLEVQILSRERA
jgi:hypothetical protein